MKENLFISFCAAAFYQTGSLLLGIPISLILSSLVFWSTLLIYQVNTKLPINIADFYSFNKIKKAEKGRLIVYTILTLTIVGHLIFLDAYTIFYFAHLGVISTLYNVPEKSRQRSFFPLRSIPILKVLLIAYVWASISSILPIINQEIILWNKALLLFCIQFLFTLAITLPFDIRDFKSDYKNYLVTVPHVLGIKGTKISALLSLIFFSILFILMTKIYPIVLLTLAAGYLIINSGPGKKDYYYTLFLDGTIILYFIIVKTITVQYI